MLKKISEYFNVKPKLTENLNLKEENYQSFVIKLEEKSKDVKSVPEKLTKLKVQRVEPKTHHNFCKFCSHKSPTEHALTMHMKNKHSTELGLFYCKLCHNKFFKIIYLDIHMKQKHPNGQTKYFECDFDGKLFKSKVALKQHMISHLPLIECSICQIKIKSLNLKSHIENVHAIGKQFQCKLCEKYFKSFQYLKRHEKNHDKIFECSKCNKKFSTKNSLISHIRDYHENLRKHECDVCEMKFNRNYNLKIHYKIHDKDRLKPFKCHRCDYATDFKTHLKNHLKFHERQDEKFASMINPLKCEKCPTFHRSQAILKDHMQKVHPNVLLQCDLCAKLVKTRLSLISHMRIHVKKLPKETLKASTLTSSFEKATKDGKDKQNIQETSPVISVKPQVEKIHPDVRVKGYYVCDFDGKTSRTKQILKTHMKCHLPKLECNICHKMLKLKSYKNHRENFHSNVRKYQCQICMRSFKTTQSLRRHEMRHNKTFNCNRCNKVFPTEWILKRHKRDYHENPKNYECKICGKKSNRLDQLRLHEKTHDKNRTKRFKFHRCHFGCDTNFLLTMHLKWHERNDVKNGAMKNPLKCEKCPKCFTEQKHLINHMKRVHPNVFFECDFCGEFIKNKRNLAYHMKIHIQKISKD